MKSAITLSLVPEAKGGPFVLWESLAEGFARAAKFGFDAIEIFPASADELDPREVRRLAKEHRLSIAAIGTGAGWVKHRLRLTDPDAVVRHRARAFIAGLVDLAGGLDAPVIVGSIQGQWQNGGSREQALAWLAEALEELGPRAGAFGVPVLYEFLNRYETNMFNRAAESIEFLDTLRTRNIQLLADLFHMNIEEADIAAALRRAGPRLGHVHFADSNRRAVGLGHTDMRPIMAALRDVRYTGYLSAEVLPLPDSDQAATQTIASFRKLTSPTKA